MAQKDKFFHMITEFGAIFFVTPFMFYLANKYKKQLSFFDRYIIILLGIITFLIDGYLFISWFMNNKKENGRKEMIKKLIRSSSRFSSAAQQDLNPLIKVLHANYGAADMFSLKNLFSEKEIEEVLGSEEIRKKYEEKIIKNQDKSTKEAVKECPKFTSALDFLSELAGES